MNEKALLTTAGCLIVLGFLWMTVSLLLSVWVWWSSTLPRPWWATALLLAAFLTTACFSIALLASRPKT